MQRDDAYILDILNAAESALSFGKGLSKKEF
jgi:uncharacterized protein with HEPN domain